MLWEIEPFSPPENISYISGNRNPEKTSYIFSKGNCSYISGDRKPEKNSLYFRKQNFLIFHYFSKSKFPSPKNEKNLTLKILIFQETELSYISRVIKTNFLIFLVLKDKNSCFFPRRTSQGFSFFTFFSVSLLTFLGCFDFSPFWMYLCCCTASATDLRELFYSQAFFILPSSTTFGTFCFYKGFPGNTDPAHLFV